EKGDASSAPLVLLPAIGGGAFIYRELAAKLETPHPIHAFEAPGLWDDRAPLESVEALAEHFLRQLHAALPAQSPILAGSSFGGMVAWEMTRQLAACGTPPSALLMMDTPGPGYLPRPLADDAEILAYLLAGDDPDGRFAEYCRKLRSIAPEERIAYAARSLETGLEEREIMRILKVYRANLRAMFSYCPQALGERLVFLRASETNSFTAPHPELAWVPLAEGGMEILPIAGSHATMLDAAHAPQLAATIRRVLGL
ncbi:MAG: alpha/beta fold hydrolase, partial [Deltaproteobacteria bacterium]|nr:alpha/beta fold hydrolase [Deltaproteobacteria bacterium]